MSYQIYPPLSDYIKKDLFSEIIGSFNDTLDNILDCIYVKELRKHRNPLSDVLTVHFSIRIHKKIGFEVLGTGIEILLYPDLDSCGDVLEKTHPGTDNDGTTGHNFPDLDYHKGGGHLRGLLTGNIVAGRPRRLLEGQIYIDVFACDGTSYIGASAGFLGIRATRLYPNTDFLRTGRFYTGSFTGINQASFTPTGTTAVYNPPINTDYTFAHEYGHVLGLADRYTSICNINDVTNQGQTRYSVSNHNPTQYPIYLPGFYDEYNNGEDHPTAHPQDSLILADLPAYNQIPYNLGAANPQQDYNKSPYDLEYSVRFGWMHNLMSRMESPNIDNTALADGQNLFIGRIGTYDYLYQFSPDLTPTTLLTPPTAAPVGLPAPLLMNGSATLAASEKTIIITTRQINVAIDKNYIEEIEHEKIFAKFKFVKQLRENNYNNGNLISGERQPFDDLSGLSNDNNKFIRQGGSFVGLIFDEYSNNFEGNLTRNNLNEAKVVSDELFDSRFAFPCTLELCDNGVIINAFGLVGGNVQITTSGPHRLNLNDVVTIKGVTSFTTASPTVPINSNINVINNAIQINGLNTFILNGVVLAAGEILASATNSRFTTNTQVVISFGVNVATIAGAAGFEVITITTSANHGFINGDFVTVVNLSGITTGAGTPGNLTFQQITVLALNQFSLAAPGAFGVYTGGGVVNQMRVNPGIEDVMDYRMSKFNKGQNIKIWTPENSIRRIGEKYGFFSLYVNNNRFSASNFSPAGLTLNPQFDNNVHNLITGNFRRFNIIFSSRSFPNGTNLQDNRLDNVGYFSKDFTRIFVWNRLRDLKQNTVLLNPQSPPPEFVENSDTYTAPIPTPLAPLYVANQNPPMDATPDDLWYPQQGQFKSWHYNTIEYYYQIYYNRLDFVLIP